MKIIIFLFAFCLGTYSSSCQVRKSAGQLTDIEIRVHRLDSIYKKALNIFDLPGFAVGIIKGGKVIYSKGFGILRLGEQNPLTAKSLFHMASVSKPFTATAIMQLVDEGKIKLDSPLTHYIAYFKMKDPRYKVITIREVLTHTSGFPDVDDYGWDKPQYEDGALERYIKDSVSTQKLLYAPGTRFAYSNMAYDVLAEVIRQVSGVPFEIYMDSHILKPCGMENSSFLMQPDKSAILVSPHVFGGSCHFEPSAVYPYNRCHAASSTLHSNLDDMLKWADMILNKGKANGNTILSPGSLQQMITPQYSDNNRSMGFSWFIRDFNGKKMIAHDGIDVGFQSYIGIIPQDSVAVVIMSNLYGFAPMWTLSLLTLNILYGNAIQQLKKPINLVIAPQICKLGFVKARENYFTLRKNEADKYDFSEEWLNKLGCAFVDLGKLDEAINVLKLNSEAYPKSLSCLINLAEIYAMAGQTKEEIASLKMALKLDPTCEECALKLSQLR